MSILFNREEFERLDQLIRLKSTGNPTELAEKFKVTERTIYRIINKLKAIGCPIYYDKTKCSYCYEYEGKILIKYETYSVDDKHLNKITGGNSKKTQNILATDIFCQCNNLYLQSKIQLAK